MREPYIQGGLDLVGNTGPQTSEHGAALIAALAVVMVLLPVGAFVALQCRTDLLIQRNLRAEIEAFYIADAGLTHALADIPLGTSFDGILAGPDRIAGSGDDGVFPFVGGSPAPFPHAPLRYDVRVTAAGTNRIALVSTSTGPGGATKVVTALVTRSALPATPAALYAAAGHSNLDLGNAGFLLSGLDHRNGDPPRAPTGSAASIPALGLPSADAESALRQRLTDTGALQLVGAAGSPSVVTVPPLDLDAYATAFGNQALRVAVPAGSISGSATFGTPDIPQLSVVGGDLDIAGQVTGSGVLLVQGTLHISGSFDFQGLLLVMGNVVCEPASNVSVLGALWQADSQDSRTQLSGIGTIAYSSTALGAVDTAFPGLLPHAAVMVGWQEQF